MQGSRSRLFWIRLLVGLSLALLLFSCRNKGGTSGGKGSDLKGTITFAPPTPAENSSLNNTLPLKLQLFDGNKVAEVQVWIGTSLLWNRNLGGYAAESKTVTTKLNVSAVADGKQALRVVMIDSEGYKVEATRNFIIDSTGPKVRWATPPLTEAIQKETNVELEVSDQSDVRQVTVYFQSKKIRDFRTPPYEFKLIPSDYPAGLVTFRVIATDSLGNSSDSSFSIPVEGSRLNQPCGFMDSCQKRLVCIRTADAPRGRCRKYCRRSRDCGSRQICRSVGVYRVCLPRNSIVLVGPFQTCSRREPCAANLLCLRRPNEPARCYPTCGTGRPKCPNGYQCLKHRKQLVCLKPPPRAALRRIGERCNSKHRCEKGALCVKLPKLDSLCYQLCKTVDDCPSGMRCRGPNKAQRICVSVDGGRRRKVSNRYEKCGRGRPCAPSLVCVGSSKGSAICHPTCQDAKSPCESGAFCFRVGSKYACLLSCDPLLKNCPSALRCSFIRLSSMDLRYLCRKPTPLTSRGISSGFRFVRSVRWQRSLQRRSRGFVGSSPRRVR